MEVGGKKLTDVLLEFDRYLSRRMTMVAVGGTALTLLGKKESTKDIDLCFPTEKDSRAFSELAKRLGYQEKSGRLIGHNLVIDVYSLGYIFCVQLPEDYLEKAVQIKDMNHIRLLSLMPMDLIITKTARLNERDMEDIKTIMESFDLDIEELINRYMKVMENSVVRDAKHNLLRLAGEFKFRSKILKKIEKWEYD